jgi:hypothetical protein
MIETAVIEEVLAVERAWTDAHLRGDMATIAHQMADDYIKIQSDGSTADKAANLASYAPDERHWELAEGDAYDVRVYGVHLHFCNPNKPAMLYLTATAMVDSLRRFHHGSGDGRSKHAVYKNRAHPPRIGRRAGGPPACQLLGAQLRPREHSRRPGRRDGARLQNL